MTPDAVAAFEDAFARRSADDYAAFLLPHVGADMTLLDCGCGPGTITYGLARHLARGRVVGLDFADDSAAARQYARHAGVANLAFTQGDIYKLPFADGAFDAVVAHSIFETLTTPSAALAEVHRVLKTGGVVGLAAVDYTGLLLSGPSAATLWRFYALKEESWTRCGSRSEPRRGSQLRSLLSRAGFKDVRATARYVSYGSGEAVRRFADDRARECSDPVFAGCLTDLALTDLAALHEMSIAWQRWGESPDAFLAFPWCNAVGWK